MKTIPRCTLVAATFVLVWCPSASVAQWQFNGTILSIAPVDQELPALVSDGAGGAIVVWRDTRNASYDVYAQRIESSGLVQWTTDGQPIAVTVGDQWSADIVADGVGGAVVVWQDARSGGFDIYAQRIDAAGAVQWTTNGVAVCAAADHQMTPAVVWDGAEAIMVWREARNGTYDIYAQKVDALGTVQWTVNGVALCTAANNQWRPAIVADGAGGAIVTWYDFRGGNFDVYAQRVDGSGTVQWASDGSAVSTATDDQEIPTMVADGAGGAIVTWQDKRSGTYDVYAQKIDAAGVVQWTADGVGLCTANLHQWSPTIASDDAGGAIVTWYDLRGSYDIYAQRIDAAGAVQWTLNGVALCTAANIQSYPDIAADGAGGAIVTWHDLRNGSYDIFSQRVDASGATQWTVNGVALCTSIENQEWPVIVSDGAEGAIVAWQDARRGLHDVYAQRVTASGDILSPVVGGVRPLGLAVGEATPNPFAGATSMAVELPEASSVSIDIFDVRGRMVRALSRPQASQRVEWDGRDQEGRLLPSGVYFCRVAAAGATVTRKMVIAR
jgi:hypothetical protein